MGYFEFLAKYWYDIVYIQLSLKCRSLLSLYININNNNVIVKKTNLVFTSASSWKHRPYISECISKKFKLEDQQINSDASKYVSGMYNQYSTYYMILNTIPMIVIFYIYM